MSNRTDFEVLADEISDQFLLSREARLRIAAELHNAFIAGQEACDRQSARAPAEPKRGWGPMGASKHCRDKKFGCDMRFGNICECCCAKCVQAKADMILAEPESK